MKAYHYHDSLDQKKKALKASSYHQHHVVLLQIYHGHRKSSLYLYYVQNGTLCHRIGGESPSFVFADLHAHMKTGLMEQDEVAVNEMPSEKPHHLTVEHYSRTELVDERQVHRQVPVALNEMPCCERRHHLLVEHYWVAELVDDGEANC